MYDKTDWRPSVYLKFERATEIKHRWKEHVKLHLDMGIPCYLWETFKDGYPEGHPNYLDIPDGVGEYPNAIWTPDCEHKFYRPWNTRGSTGWHLPEICNGFCSVAIGMQIAVLRGATEIYLVGCDLGFTKPPHHFVDNYIPGGDYNANTDKLVRMSHEVAERDCPIPIYNATIGGELEVHKRVNLEDIL